MKSLIQCEVPNTMWRSAPQIMSQQLKNYIHMSCTIRMDVPSVWAGSCFDCCSITKKKHTEGKFESGNSVVKRFCCTNSKEMFFIYLIDFGFLVASSLA